MYILHFCLRKEVKNLLYAGFSTKSELCIPSEDKDIASPSCCHGNYFYLATKFKNIMNDLQTHFEHSKFNSGSQDETPCVAMVAKSTQGKKSFLRSRGICIPNLSFLCLKMAEIETFILLPWQLIYPSNHTQKLLFKSTVTSIPNLGLQHLQTAEI